MFTIRDNYPYSIFLLPLQSLVPNRETYAAMSFILAILFNILYLTLILEINGGKGRVLRYIPSTWENRRNHVSSHSVREVSEKMGGHLRRCIFFSTPQLF